MNKGIGPARACKQLAESMTRRRGLAPVCIGAALVLWFAAALVAQTPKAGGTAEQAPSAASNASPTFLRQAGDYSEAHRVIVIAILKGQKETSLTGDQIGEKLADLLKNVYGAPSKYFVAPGGDYTSIIYFVKGHLYGPYGLKDSLNAITLAADAYDERVRGKSGEAKPPQ